MAEPEPIHIALEHGDLARLVLVMDNHLNGMKKLLKGVRIQVLEQHYDRLVSTRNKVQAAWKASLPKRPRRKKARKASG